MSCRFCLTESTESYFSTWCGRCHKLQRLISLFGGEKVMSILENVLIVDKDSQKEKIKEELKGELTTREYNLRARKEAEWLAKGFVDYNGRYHLFFLFNWFNIVLVLFRFNVCGFTIFSNNRTTFAFIWFGTLRCYFFFIFFFIFYWLRFNFILMILSVTSVISVTASIGQMPN